MMKHFLGVDLGTSAVKAALFNERGERVALAIEEYTLLTPGEDLCEVPARLFWDGFRSALARALDESGVRAESIVALAPSSQGETFVPVDAFGRPLRNAISWLDNRSHAESDALEERFGRDLVYRTSGQPAVCPIWTATKILWLRNNKPEIFGKAHKYLLAEDYLIHRLSGRFVSEYSVYSSSLLLDITRRAYWADMLDFLGISEDRLPELVESGTAVGCLTQEAAEETGLSPKTLVVTGAYDHAAGSIGAGVTHAGVISETTGSSMAICAPIDAPAFDPGYRVPCHCHAVPGKYFFSPYGETAGMVMKWFRDRFCEPETAAAEASGKSAFEVMGELAAAVPAGSEGLLLLPFLSGTGSPEFNPRARGVYFGMTLKHTKGHFIRAVMESVAYMIARNIEVMEELGARVEELRCLGGGAQSDLWCQIKADALQRRVVVVEESEQALKGAAILAGLGAGVFDDLESAGNRMVAIRKSYEPNAATAEVYDKGCVTYGRLYNALEALF